MVTTSTFARTVSLFSSLVLGLLFSLSSVAQDAVSTDGIGLDAQRQIADIISLKRGFTSAQNKIDSQTNFAALAAQGSTNGASFANAIAPVQVIDSSGAQTPVSANTPEDKIRVEIYGSGGAEILNKIAEVGGTAGDQFAMEDGRVLVTATIQLDKIQSVAELDAVSSIRAAYLPHSNVGALTSQAIISHATKTVNANGIDGTGVKVGVMSDSASPARVAALIASGDLGAGTVVLPGQAGSGSDEGTAMMEIVQDMAPGAKLYFATAFAGQASFANNILALQAAGCRVIVDDVTYFAEGAFQDGPIAQAVNAVTAAGVVYVSSAANSGNLTLGTSGTWEGDFSSLGPVGGPIAAAGETGLVHNFGTAASPQGFDVLTGTSQIISLKWSDALGASANDYDLFVLNSTGTTLKAFSAGAQTGTQDPLEIFQYTPAAGDRIVVVLFSGAARALHLDTNRGRLSINTTGSTYGHNAGRNTVTAAATYWNSARTGTRPFTGAANPIETFSSDGPRKIFYNPNGTAITPGNFLFGTNGGTTLQKPEVTGADGVSTKTPGFLPFFGTSAASPHIAGIAALVLQAVPTLTADQVKAALRGGTVDNMAAGVDRDSGFGIVMATLAVQYAITH